MKSDVLTSTTDSCIVRISGEVDISSETALERIEEEVAPASRVVIDASNLKYADTAFLRFLIRVSKQPNKGRDSVRVVGATRQLRRVFEVTGLSTLFSVQERAAVSPHSR
jgi:anti-sigma B factor antagonist